MLLDAMTPKAGRPGYEVYDVDDVYGVDEVDEVDPAHPSRLWAAGDMVMARPVNAIGLHKEVTP